MSGGRGRGGASRGGGGAGGGGVARFAMAKLPRLIEVLDALGYGRTAPPEHARLAAAGEGVRITLYESGKLLVQGKRAAEVEAELAAFGLIPGSTAALEAAVREGFADRPAGPAAAPAARPAAPRSAAAAGPRAPGGGAADPALAPATRDPATGDPATGDPAAGDPATGGPATAAPPLAIDAGTAVIGSDETGKGDFFGRLVVAACAVDALAADELRDLGVADSKALTDRRVAALAARIRARCPSEVVSITPRRYNEMYASFKNVNTLLAWAHGRAIEGLCERYPGIRRAVVDQFAADPRVVTRALGERGRALDLRQRTRGEEEMPVAAASVLARDVFVRTLAELSDRFGMELPKGASAQVDAAGRRFVEKHGKEALVEVAKLHFRTTEKILGPAMFR